MCARMVSIGYVISVPEAPATAPAETKREQLRNQPDSVIYTPGKVGLVLQAQSNILVKSHMTITNGDIAFPTVKNPKTLTKAIV